LGPDAELNRREISKFSTKDAETLPRYEAMLTKAADFLEPLLQETPPDPWSGFSDLWKVAQLAWRFRKLAKEAVAAIDIPPGASRPFLERWWESGYFKVTLPTHAVIGVPASPSIPGTAYVLFHHVMGECDGVRGVWGYVRGGMGAISQAIASAAKK